MVAVLLNSPSATMVPVTVTVALPLAEIEAIVHGIAVQAPVKATPDKFTGVSVSATLVAADGPVLLTVMV